MNPSLVLSFDLDDTLWPVAPVIAAAEQDLWKWLRERHPQTVSGHSLESLQAMRALTAERYPEHGHDLTFLRHRALKDLFEAAGTASLPAGAAAAAAATAAATTAAARSPADVESLADEALEVFFAARNRVEFYHDVRPSLQRLHARYRLFALSNGNADLHRCGIAHWFTGHVTARSAGAAKPDARIFARLLAEAGVEAHEVLHIGDDPVTDVVGAMQAGMQAVWLNREARAWPKHLPRPPRTITTLAEII
jgi:FMN hydrolase / 5-amino-6-(5-phospho-D-ribitylamino)uracil phosphatase